LFGNGAVLDVPKANWQVITAADLQKAAPGVKDGDIVVIVTGWHHKYSDGLEYYGEAPGLSKDAAEWLVSKNPKMVAVDTPHVDHPLATSMAPHRGGPQMKRLTSEYAKATGLDWKVEHPEWNVAHKILLGAGIPTVEQVGGDVDIFNIDNDCHFMTDHVRHGAYSKIHPIDGALRRLWSAFGDQRFQERFQVWSRRTVRVVR
jgi:kynurenine formamidase